MEERQEFIRAYMRRDRSLQALCGVFGVSRKTAYKWLSRFMQGGLPALVERSRARQSMPHKTPPWTEELIVACRKKFPRFGPKKIVSVVQGQHPAIQFPSPSTAGEILKRRGLIVDGKHRSKRYPRPSSFEPRPVLAPNSTWCGDFKGQFELKNGVVCYPATLTDAFSRKLLRCQALTTIARGPTQAVWTSAFREYGLPLAVRTDNGVPFLALHFQREQLPGPSRASPAKVLRRSLKHLPQLFAKGRGHFRFAIVRATVEETQATEF